MSNDNTINRWDMDREYEYPHLEQYNDGEYVLYSDHIKAIAYDANGNLEARIKELEQENKLAESNCAARGTTILEQKSKISDLEQENKNLDARYYDVHGECLRLTVDLAAVTKECDELKQDIEDNWQSVIDICAAASPNDKVYYDQSPTELIVDLVNQRDVFSKERDIAVQALERLRDCDWVITLPDRMDGVRNIANSALLAIKGAK